MKKLNSKELLVETLYEMMHQQPFHEISITDLLKRCGVSRTTYYRHFYDKTDLLIHLFESKIVIRNFFTFYAPSYERERDFLYFLQQDISFWLHVFSVQEVSKRWYSLAQKSLLMEYQDCFSSPEDAYFFSSAMASAFVQINTNYLANPRNQTPEDIALSFKKTIMGTLQGFSAKTP